MRKVQDRDPFRCFLPQGSWGMYYNMQQKSRRYSLPATNIPGMGTVWLSENDLDTCISDLFRNGIQDLGCYW